MGDGNYGWYLYWIWKYEGGDTAGVYSVGVDKKLDFHMERPWIIGLVP